MILADVEKISDGLTSLEGKYVNVYKKILQIEKSKTSQQTAGDFIMVTSDFRSELDKNR